MDEIAESAAVKRECFAGANFNVGATEPTDGCVEGYIADIHIGAKRQFEHGKPVGVGETAAIDDGAIGEGEVRRHVTQLDASTFKRCGPVEGVAAGAIQCEQRRAFVTQRAAVADESRRRHTAGRV